MIAGADKFGRAPGPRLKFTFDDKPLSEKEAKDLEPRIEGALKFAFRYMDKGITATNRERAEAEIWTDIDDEDIKIIAGHLVEMAKASRIIATAVRRVSNSYRLLQIGLITGPKFWASFRFYGEHGGFSLFPPKRRRAE